MQYSIRALRIGFLSKAAEDTDWAEVHTFRSKRLVDGTFGAGLLMRRRLNGSFQYRRFTKEEESDRLAHHAW